MRPIQIIAECGINHNGSDKIARELIREAKNAGADCAKFQLYDPRKREDIEDHKWKDILLESRLTKRQLYFLKDECDRADIEFMCSVFDVERVGWLEEIGVKRYKIASKSVYDVDLVMAIYNTGKDIIVSSGMLDGKSLVDCLLSKNVNWLYCISLYPTVLSTLNFYESNGVKSIFNFHYLGFSDHTIGITASIVAMSLGARIIEKHFTLDKTAPGPDHLLSVEPQELRMLCKHRDDIERILYG